MNQYYTTSEASKLLNMKIRTLREWIKLGKIKCFKLEGGRRNYITHEEIMRVTGGVINDI